jgi:gamma-glutamylcyclotransferase (GGCT)/AIG2-like uncharacterized protein YtfP
VSGVNVFTYGSLMFEPVWRKVCAGIYRTQAATLEGYSRLCVRDESYPAVIAEPGAKVDGLLYFDVSVEDQDRLNRFEGSEYRLQQGQIGEQAVVFYEFILLDRVAPIAWSPEHFELYGLPQFLAEHVGAFLESGTRNFTR